MSYMQGTKVRVIGEFRDPDTDALEDPDDVVVSVWPPDGSATSVRRLSTTGVTRVSQGVFQTVIDTSPAAGDWNYLFEGTGTDAVVKKRTIRVRPRPVVVP